MFWDDHYIDELERQVGVRVNDAATFLRDSVKANIAIDGPPRSLPGEFPRRDTTHLYFNIDQNMDFDDLKARVGTLVFYGAFLEFGTEKMLPRPWLVKTLDEQTPAIVKIILNKP